MSNIVHGLKRVAAVLEEIERLRQSEFPYNHPREALDLLAERFRRHQSILKKAAPASPDVINNVCSVSWYELLIYLPILGFILRSTNVRNAFEVYAPLLRLARRILGEDTRLILSSEWELSPFVYRSITGLGGFVLIGLPAPESANPLLVPLAGHELGHSVWQREELTKRFEVKITDGIRDELTNNRWIEYTSVFPNFKKEDLFDGNLFARSTWMPAYTWAKLQAEEMFCDFFGLQLFSESFLHAFSYLLSPGVLSSRSPAYPGISRRVSHLMKAADVNSVSLPTGFETSFIAENEPTDPRERLLLSVADKVSASLELELINVSKGIADAKTTPTRTSQHVSSIRDTFSKWVTPVLESHSLTDIVNAGWQCILDSDLWKTFSHIRPEDKDRILKDLVLKSIEVSEISAKLEKNL